MKSVKQHFSFLSYFNQIPFQDNYLITAFFNGFIVTRYRTVEINLNTKFELSQNYPNPFNPKTKIDFNLPVDSKIELKEFDVTGKEVAYIIRSEYHKAGFYTTEFDCSHFASGTYFYRIYAKGSNGYEYLMTKKMSLIK